MADKISLRHELIWPARQSFSLKIGMMGPGLPALGANLVAGPRWTLVSTQNSGHEHFTNVDLDKLF